MISMTDEMVCGDDAFSPFAAQKLIKVKLIRAIFEMGSCVCHITINKHSLPLFLGKDGPRKYPTGHVAQVSKALIQ